MESPVAKYSRDWLIEQIDKGQTFDYLFFYGHKLSTDGSVTASCCSQWFPSPFELDGQVYPTAEHYMMAQKAHLFVDPDMKIAIMESKTPKEAKAFGRKVKNFDAELWQNCCTQIVVRANYAKFYSNPALADWLVKTAPEVIVEASMWDRIWGIGMVSSAPGARDPKSWKGSNLLGFALMEVRDLLTKT